MALIPLLAGQTQTVLAHHLSLRDFSKQDAVLTYHNDFQRTGQNLYESILTSNNANPYKFGKRVVYPVDGQVYAQPLFVPNVTINTRTYNVVYVATERDSVYAFDADQLSSVAPLWHISFIKPTAGITTVPSTDLYYLGMYQDTLKAYGLVNGLLTTTPTSQTQENLAFSGARASISSNGTIPGTAIAWAISPATGTTPGGSPNGPAVLRAYDATNLSIELYNSEQNAGRDRLDSYVKFTVPTVAGGRVFVGTKSTLTIFGLLPQK